ncbi:MAG: ArgR family transcriptional regulator [Bacteroidales bacterium]|nr:ArgR family transcriptional regulator [Bacteroidales bacterium]
MGKRTLRLEAIVELIRTNTISSQTQLAEMLAERGFDTTQGTLSRDLKTLNTSKIPTDKGYLYVLPDLNELKNRLIATGSLKPEIHSGTGFISLEFSGNICVVKTRNGYAPGLAFDIDMIGASEILGTIAGANTIFVAIREGISHDRVRDILSRILPLDKKTPTF